jgi:hypothetical protein
MQRIGWVVVLALVFGLVGVAQAQDNPTGTWTWTTDFGGKPRENTLKLKLEGDKLTGALIGRNNQETPIEEGTYKNGELSFKVTRERGGQKFTTKYTGKVTGDTIKGKIETDFGGKTQSRDWTAKRSSN